LRRTLPLAIIPDGNTFFGLGHRFAHFWTAV
jgi:hypothetical protein